MGRHSRAFYDSHATWAICGVQAQIGQDRAHDVDRTGHGAGGSGATLEVPIIFGGFVSLVIPFAADNYHSIPWPIWPCLLASSSRLGRWCAALNIVRP